MAERSVTIRILGDASKGKKAFQDIEVAVGQTEGKLGKFGSALGGVAQIAGGFVVGQALTQLPNVLGAAAGKAVSLEQNAKKAAIVFGDELGSVEEWASTAAHGMGLTNREAVTLAAGMGDLLVPLGFSRKAAADMSTETLNLAGALAEWSGGQYDAAQVSDILTKAMLGETDGLKALGISISAEEIARKAATLTGKEYANMTEAQKNALATQMLITEKSTDAQKAYAESQDDTASRQAIATARMKEAQEQISIALLPAITLLTTGFAAVASILATAVVPAIIGAVQAFVGFIQPIAAFVADNLPVFLAGLAGIAAGILGVVIPALVAWVVGMVPVIAAHVAMAAAVVVAYAPVIAIVVAVGAAVALLYLAWQENLFGIRDITQQVWDFVRPYFESAIGAIRTVVETVFPIIAQIVTTYIGILRTEIELGIAAARWAFDNVFVPIQGIVMDVFNTIAGIVATVWGPTVVVIQSGVDNAKAAFDGLVYIQGVVSDIFTTIAGLVNSLWLGASGAVSLIGAGLATVYGFFEGAYDKMHAFGAAMLQGLIDGARSLIGVFEGVWNTVSAIADKIIAAKNLISSPSRLMFMRGQQMMQGLTLGVESGIPGYENTWSRVADIGDRSVSGAGSGNTGGTGTRGTTGTGNTGGGGTRGTSGSGNTGGRGVPRDYDGPGFYYEKPNNGQGDGVIGDPAYMEIPPSGHFDNPQNVGGGKSFGVFSERMATKAAEKIDEANDDYLSRLDKRDRDFLREMSRYVERIVRSNEAVPGATAKAVQAALASAI